MATTETANAAPSAELPPSGASVVMRNPKDRLREALLSLCGPAYADTIEVAVNKYAEHLLNQGKSFDEILDYMLTVVKGAGINRQSPAEPRTDTRQSQSQSHSPEKRSMPVKPKESIHPPIIPPPLEVYDEWAAVLRHQDEVSLAAEERERQLQKERQRLYSQQLAAQKAELDSRMRRNTEVGSVEDREAVQLQTDFVKQKAELEKLQSAEKRAKAESIMQENLVEKRRATMAVKELEKQDNMMVLEQIKRINEEGEQKVRDEKDVKVRVVNALRESYEIQEEMKRRQRMQTKELDKVFLKKEEELSQENERNRQRYFDVLREKQRMTSEKERRFQGYAQVKLEDLQKRDEMTQLKYINESLKKAETEAIRAHETKSHDQLTEQLALRQQVDYKRSVRAARREEDREYAERIRQKDREVETRERQLAEEQRKRQQEYRALLQDQIRNTNQRRLFEGVMSDHERRVNNREIEAYENMDMSVHAKVVGVKAPDEIEIKSSGKKAYRSRDGSIEANPEEHRQFGFNNVGANNSENPYAPTAGPPQPNYDLEVARKLNAAEILPKHRAQLQNVSPSKVSSRLAEIAAKNMDDPNLLIMRSNTHNTSYGYRPPVKYRPPSRPAYESKPTTYESAAQMKTVDARVDPQPTSVVRRSVEAKPAEPAADWRYGNRRVPTPDHNKSFAYGQRENLLAGAGKEQMRRDEGAVRDSVPQTAEQAPEPAAREDQESGRDRRGHSVEPPAEGTRVRLPRRDDYRTMDVVKMRPAGMFRRQVVNYNIITGSGK